MSTACTALSTMSSKSTLFSTVHFHFKSVYEFGNATQTTSRYAEMSASNYTEENCRELPVTRWMKSAEFCFIEGIVQWWPMGKYILKHK